jgi:hypothetical protein
VINVFKSYGKALGSQLHPRMLALTLLPAVLAMVLLGALMWWGLQELMDVLQDWFSTHGGFDTATKILSFAGLLTLKAVIVPILAMWLLLPILIIVSMLFIAVFAMPVISRHVTERDYPGLEQKQGGSYLGSIWHALKSFCIFALLWIVTWPLSLYPPVGMVIQPLLWGWLTYRVMAYDALARHADLNERLQLLHEHRWQLLAIGCVAAIAGAAPGLLWLGGAVFLFPFFASLSVWLYVLVFVFTGLWFQYYCLMALQAQRAQHDERREPVLENIHTIVS